MWEKSLEVKMLDGKILNVFNSKGYCQTAFQSIYHPAVIDVWEFPFSYTLTNTKYGKL